MDESSWFLHANTYSGKPKITLLFIGGYGQIWKSYGLYIYIYIYIYIKMLKHFLERDVVFSPE